MIYALDTNSVAYFFRGEEPVGGHLLAKRPRDIVVPALVAYELRYGVACLENAARRYPTRIFPVRDNDTAVR